MVMIREGSHKYIAAAGDPPQLFNLANDPNELKNLAVNPDQATRIANFETTLARHWNLDDIDRDIKRSQIERKVVSEALTHGVQQDWDYQPQPDFSQLYVRDPSGAELADRRVRVPAKGYRLPGT